MTTTSNAMHQPLLPIHDGASQSASELANRMLENRHRVFLNKFRISSITLGFIVGLFIQFSTLGANWLIVSIFGNDALINASRFDLIVYSLCWSGLTSGMSMWMLSFLRDLVNVVLLHECTSQEERVIDDETRRRLELMMLTMESRFVGGALAGVCFSWTLTDYLLGLRVQMIYSLITLIVATFWGFVLLRVFSVQIAGDSTTEKRADEENQGVMVSAIVV